MSNSQVSIQPDNDVDGFGKLAGAKSLKAASAPISAFMSLRNRLCIVNVVPALNIGAALVLS